MLPSRCIILGSGNSISQGISLGLSNYIENNVTFGINESIKFFDTTAVTFMDWCAYRDRFELYSQHPLTIGCFDNHIGNHIEGATPCPKHDSLILLHWSGKWNDNPLKNGLYAANLCGGFTLSLAIALGFTEIYLLGFDMVEINGRTHYYQGIEGAGIYNDFEGKSRTGVGKNEKGEYNSSLYNNSDKEINANWDIFQKVFATVKIVNVSPKSRITTFPKMDYPTFFKTIGCNSKINHFRIQEEIREILEPFNKLGK